MKDLYLAGGSYYDLQEVFSRMPGIEAAVAGIASVKGGAEPAECVKVTYNPKLMDITSVLEMYFNVVDTYTPAAEPRLRSGIYYVYGEDAIQIEYYMRFFQTRGCEPQAALGNLIVNDSYDARQQRPPLQTELGRLASFTEAPEEEQFYLRKHPQVKSAVNLEALAAAGLIK